MAMNGDVFDRLAKDTKMSPKSLEAARLVMVDGMRPGEAAAKLGLLLPQVSRSTKTLYEKERELRESGQLASPETETVERNLNASYTLAVQRAREQAGEETVLSAAEPNKSYLGTAIARTDMHVVQDLGRGQLVIHELAKLQRVPVIGSMFDIKYSEDLRRPALVVEQVRSHKRGGISR
ncbi:KfrB domain-containing protein [Trinickia mobilis]